MALAIALRSPYYISDTAGTGANSAKLTISIDGTIEYTLAYPYNGIAMPLSCCSHALVMSLSCPRHVVVMPLSCRCHALAMF